MLAIVVLAVALGASAASGPLPDEARVRETIRRILARPEYQEPPVSLMERALRAVGRVVGRIVEWLLKPIEWLVDKLSQATPEMSPSARWLVVGVLVFLLVALLLHLYYMVTRSFQDRLPRERAGARRSGVDPREMLARAAALASAGNYAEAVRALYVAVLLHLDRAGVVAYEPSRTNWAYAEAVGGGEEGRAFRELTRIADRAMYGGGGVTAEEYSTAQRLAERMGVVVE